MDTLIHVLLVLVIFAAVGVIVVIGSAVDRRAEAKRATEMAVFARENGFHVLRKLSAFRRTLGDFSLCDRRARLTELVVKGFELEARGDTILFHLGSRASFDDLTQLINRALAIREACADRQ